MQVVATVLFVLSFLVPIHDLPVMWPYEEIHRSLAAKTDIAKADKYCDRQLNVTRNGNALDLIGQIGVNAVEVIKKARNNDASITKLRLVRIDYSVCDERTYELLLDYIRKNDLTTVVPYNGLVAYGGEGLALGSKSIIENGACVGVVDWGYKDPVSDQTKPLFDLDRGSSEHELYLESYQAAGLSDDFYWFALEAAGLGDVHWMSPAEINRFNNSQIRLDESGTETYKQRQERCDWYDDHGPVLAKKDCMTEMKAIRNGNALDLFGTIGVNTVEAIKKARNNDTSVSKLRLVGIDGAKCAHTSLWMLFYYIRKNGLTTVVPSHGRVSSGGTLTAGSNHIIEDGACIGVHSWRRSKPRFFLRPLSGYDLSRDAKEHDRWIELIRAIGMSDEFYWFTLKTASDDMHWMSPAEINRFKLSQVPLDESSGATHEQRQKRCDRFGEVLAPIKAPAEFDPVKADPDCIVEMEVTRNGDVLDLVGSIGVNTVQVIKKARNNDTSVTKLRLVRVEGSVCDEASLDRLLLYIRENDLTTVVPSNGLAVAGGNDLAHFGTKRVIENGACIGVNSWSFDESGPGQPSSGSEYRRESEVHDFYLKMYQAVGISDEFYWFTLKAAGGSGGTHWMSPAEINRFNLSQIPLDESGRETDGQRYWRCERR